MCQAVQRFTIQFQYLVSCNPETLIWFSSHFWVMQLWVLMGKLHFEASVWIDYQLQYDILLMSPPSCSLPSAAAAPPGKMVFTYIPIGPYMLSLPPTILNPRPWNTTRAVYMVRTQCIILFVAYLTCVWLPCHGPS